MDFFNLFGWFAGVCGTVWGVNIGGFNYGGIFVIGIIMVIVVKAVLPNIGFVSKGRDEKYDK